MLLLSVLHTLSVCSTQSVLTSSVNDEPARLSSRRRVGGPVVSFETVCNINERMNAVRKLRWTSQIHFLSMTLTGVLPNVGATVMISFMEGANVDGKGVRIVGSAVMGDVVGTSVTISISVGKGVIGA